MSSKGIRISDEKNDVVCIDLQDILEEINNGNSLNWSILFFYGMGHLKDGKSIPDFEEEVRNSERGVFLTWDDLNMFADSLWQAFDFLVIGCTDPRLIVRHENDQEMYETCDIVIHMHDCCFWEVFSRDEDLISRLVKKFKKIEFLKPDFLASQVENGKGKIKTYKVYAPDRRLPRNSEGVPIPEAGPPLTENVNSL